MLGAFYLGQPYLADAPSYAAAGSGPTSIVIEVGSYILSFGQLQRLPINPRFLSIKQDLTKIWEQS